MNTPNPLLPQGSLESQQLQRRSATKIVVSAILGLHGIVLGGLLFLGCKEEPEVASTEPVTTYGAYEPATNTGPGSPFGDLTSPLTEDVFIPAPDTNFGSVLPPLPPGSEGGNSFVSKPGFTGGNSGGFADNSSNFPPHAGTTFELIETDPVPELTKYTVLPNDNFWTIARKHGVTAKAITDANANVDSRRLKVGQVLNLPSNVKPSPPALPDGGPSSSSSTELKYKVVSGDNLLKISKKYGVTVKAIQQANGIRGSLIKVGQQLIIPVPSDSGSGQ